MINIRLKKSSILCKYARLSGGEVKDAHSLLLGIGNTTYLIALCAMIACLAEVLGVNFTNKVLYDTYGFSNASLGDFGLAALIFNAVVALFGVAAWLSWRLLKTINIHIENS